MFQNTKIKRYKGISTTETLLLVWFCLFIWFISDVRASGITYEGMIKNSSVEPPFEIYSKLKDECFAQDVEDKEHCIKTGLAIAYAECTWKDYETPFGLQSKDKSYKKWVSSYKKFWYTARDGHFFYGDWGEYGKSRYCTSEESSWSSKGCPNWRRNFNSVYYNINF